MKLSDELATAACSGELQPVVKWLQKGGRVDALDENGVGLLHLAACNGHLHMVKELLQRGASVDLHGAMGITALMLAAGAGQYAMMRLLLEHKAGIDLHNETGMTALMAAAHKGHTECVQELLQTGASTELRDQDGRTAMKRAEDNGQAAIAKLLRQHAATPPATVAAPTPSLSGRRVRIDGLQARPELNGRCGVAGTFDAAKGRYEGAGGVAGGVVACCRSSSAMVAWLRFSATCCAVKPRWSRSSVLAPASSSSCTHSFWPWLAATIRAVAPSAFCRSMLVLCSSSRRTMAC